MRSSQSGAYCVYSDRTVIAINTVRPRPYGVAGASAVFQHRTQTVGLRAYQFDTALTIVLHTPVKLREKLSPVRQGGLVQCYGDARGDGASGHGLRGHLDDSRLPI